MSITPVGSHHLYDPDYTSYYDDTPPCSHGHGHDHGHSEHHANCNHDYHHDNCNHQHQTKILKNDNDLNDDDDVPDLIEINKFTYEPNHSSRFPDYPEFEPRTYPNGKLEEENIKDTRSSFRKKLEGSWDYCWSNICAFILYCKPLAMPLFKFYHQVYIPYVLVNILNLCGGPKHAGRIGRYARISQYVGACITWSALIVLIVMVGFTSVWTLGLASPLWALILGFGGVGINMTGSMIAAAANHGKIEPYYHEEIKLHDENNAIRRKIGIPEMGLEHGYLHSSKERQNVHMHRYEHDAHTWVVGSGSSIAASVLEIASIAVGLGGIFLMISRFSSVISLFGATYVNRDRLFLFKRVISKKINSYYGLKHLDDPKKHKAIYKLLTKKFNELHINKNHYYSRWVKFYCYRAIDAAFNNITDENAVTINNILHRILENTPVNHDDSFDDENSNQMRFSRTKLRGLLKTDELCVLESMPVLESKLRDELESSKENKNYNKISSAVNEFSSKHLDSPDENSFLFKQYLKCALMKNSMTSIKVADLERAVNDNIIFFTKNENGTYILNLEKISQVYPLKGPHGNQIISDYHAKQMVDHIIIPSLKAQKGAVENINKLLMDYYLTKMDASNASSFLFILHLKCALLTHAINDVTKDDLEAAVKFGKEFFSTESSPCLNKEKIAEAFPVDDKHGGLTQPDDHAKELVDNLIIPYLNNKPLKDSFDNMNNAVNEFYKNDMDTDASSDLFILHLKCALIKALVDKKINTQNITCENIKNAFEKYSDCYHRKNATSKPVLDLAKISKELDITKNHEPVRVFVNERIMPKLCNVSSA